MLYKIYGVSDCPYCLKAQALCMENNLEYIWVELSYSKEYQDHIKGSWLWKTYPIITTTYITESSENEEYLLGGFAELKESIYEDI